MAAEVNVFLFVPNLIGYARVVLGIASLFYMVRKEHTRHRTPGACARATWGAPCGPQATEPYTAMALYWLSAFLDVFDGMAARRFNQSSRRGPSWLVAYSGRWGEKAGRGRT
jgi:CDP-diacylglycerol--inositol 3-phosphatidyltransferase